MKQESEVKLDIDKVIEAKKIVNDLIQKYLVQLNALGKEIDEFYMNPVNLEKFKEDLFAQQRIDYILEQMGYHTNCYVFRYEEQKAKVFRYFDRLMEFKRKFDLAVVEFNGKIEKLPKCRCSMNEPTFFDMDLFLHERFLKITRIINRKDYKTIKKLLKKQGLDCDYLAISKELKIRRPDYSDKGTYDGDKCVIRITEHGDNLSKFW